MSGEGESKIEVRLMRWNKRENKRPSRDEIVEPAYAPRTNYEEHWRGPSEKIK